jgi:hypothetical protein
VQQRTGNTLEPIHISNGFLSRTLVAQQVRERIDISGYKKLKSFCPTKEIVSKLKRPSTEWEEIFASYTSDLELIARIHREFTKLNYPQINNPVKKWAY